MQTQTIKRISARMKAFFVISITIVLFATMYSPVTLGQGGGADFTRFVGVGDSLTAGVKDGALFSLGQQQAFYPLVAQSMNTQIVLPLIAEPGIPTPNPAAGEGLMLQIPGTCEFGATVPAIGVSSGRVNTMLQATNVAVPDQRIGEALTIRWSIDPANVQGTADSAEDFILGFPYVFSAPRPNTPRSQIETAIGLQPTFVSFWLGSNDALGAALSGTVNDTTLTPVDDFNASAHAAADAIASTGARAVLLNVPDVTVIPNFFSIVDLEALTGLSEQKLANRLGIDANSFVPMSAIPAVEAILNRTARGPLAPNQVLTAKEVKTLRKRIKMYNQTLRMIATEKGWAFTDIFTRFLDFDSNGVNISGIGRLTTSYLGGLFGLDGIHPSATGHALIAEAVIESINARYGTALQLPNVAAIASADPQVCMASASIRYPELLRRAYKEQVAYKSSQRKRADSLNVIAN